MVASCQPTPPPRVAVAPALEQVQLGMQLRGFKGSRTNPLREPEIPNMQRALAEYLARSSNLDQSPV